MRSLPSMTRVSGRNSKSSTNTRGRSVRPSFARAFASRLRTFAAALRSFEPRSPLSRVCFISR